MRKLFYLLLILHSASIAQQETFFAKSLKNELLIGEPTQITFELSFPSSIAIESVSFPIINPKDTLGNGWELWSIDSVQILNFEDDNGGFITQISQEIEIANFDTGKHEFPLLIATIEDRNIYSNSIEHTIESVKLLDDQSINNIKDIKLDPLTFFDKLRRWFEKYWLIILGSFLLIFSLIIVYKKLTSKKQKDIISKPKIPTPIILLKKLKEIEEEKLWQKGNYKQYYTKVNSVGWEFIEYRYGIATFEKTSLEILSSLRLSSINDKWIVKLGKLFTISDLVKFAKQIPTEQENIFTIQTIREFIEQERDDLLTINNEEPKE